MASPISTGWSSSRASTSAATPWARTRTRSVPRSRPTTATMRRSWARPATATSRRRSPRRSRRWHRSRPLPQRRAVRPGRSEGRPMRLRPRQKVFVERSLAALSKHGNTLGVAPTGAGKTIMLSAVTGKLVEKTEAKACVLAHRDELTGQNRAKFARVNPEVTTSVVDAGSKSWAGQVTFAMAPTLSRSPSLKAMPTLDLLVIDEAHHAVADSYRRIIDRVRDANPEARIFGVTATPNRGDKKGLRDVFDNVADQVRLGELIASGHLVPPRTFVIDVGVQDKLKAVRKTASDFDMGEVAEIMDRAPITEEVVRNWQENAADRPTVIFCSTVAHAGHVAEAFNAAGIPAGLIHGDLPGEERRAILAAFARGEIRVVTNVAVLTEGWDHPPTSCVVLLRPSSYKSTMIQMVGRSLRTVDPAEHPGVVKTDCIVLDFGTSTLMHGALEQDVDLDGRDPAPCDAPTKTCPECEATVPLAARQCPICGYEFLSDGAPPLESVVMSEIDLLKRSSFAWEDLFDDESALMASGFNAWGGVFFL